MIQAAARDCMTCNSRVGRNVSVRLCRVKRSTANSHQHSPSPLSSTHSGMPFQKNNQFGGARASHTSLPSSFIPGVPYVCPYGCGTVFGNRRGSVKHLSKCPERSSRQNITKMTIDELLELGKTYVLKYEILHRKQEELVGKIANTCFYLLSMQKNKQQGREVDGKDDGNVDEGNGTDHRDTNDHMDEYDGEYDSDTGDGITGGDQNDKVNDNDDDADTITVVAPTSPVTVLSPTSNTPSVQRPPPSPFPSPQPSPPLPPDAQRLTVAPGRQPRKRTSPIPPRPNLRRTWRNTRSMGLTVSGEKENDLAVDAALLTAATPMIADAAAVVTATTPSLPTSLPSIATVAALPLPTNIPSVASDAVSALYVPSDTTVAPLPTRLSSVSIVDAPLLQPSSLSITTVTRPAPSFFTSPSFGAPNTPLDQQLVTISTGGAMSRTPASRLPTTDSFSAGSAPTRIFTRSSLRSSVDVVVSATQTPPSLVSAPPVLSSTTRSSIYSEAVALFLSSSGAVSSSLSTAASVLLSRPTSGISEPLSLPAAAPMPIPTPTPTATPTAISISAVPNSAPAPPVDAPPTNTPNIQSSNLQVSEEPATSTTIRTPINGVRKTRKKRIWDAPGSERRTSSRVSLPSKKLSEARDVDSVMESTRASRRR
ncbi:uncharacterized protein V1518DRAFT_421961 [Limtongia smithiae]|uniref:uncharacterized protein n=1 Tax=Limtongia smithiae TaxID=1125753 RepID=UPI0034CFC142